jgi:glutathione S-transferase
MYIKFPTGNYLNIPEAAKGQGVPDIAEVGTFAPFFQWRDKLYADYRQASATAAPPAGGRPTAIDIE